jgi:hypothetical protein
MEVHHHPQIEKKNFKEYLLEGLMIFLAVTLGFFAESIRENISDGVKENHYMISLVNDLETDTAFATECVENEVMLSAEMDAALRIPTEQLHDLNKQDTFYFHFLIFFNFAAIFRQDDNTLVELRNAGGFSVIKKQAVTDSIIALVNYYNFVTGNEAFYHDDFLKVEDFTSSVIKIPYLPTAADGNSVYPPLLQNTEVFTQYDKQQLEKLYSLIQIERTQLDFYRLVVSKYKAKATALIAFLQKEYHLEK